MPLQKAIAGGAKAAQVLDALLVRLQGTESGVEWPLKIFQEDFICKRYY